MKTNLLISLMILFFNSIMFLILYLFIAFQKHELNNLSYGIKHGASDSKEMIYAARDLEKSIKRKKSIVSDVFTSMMFIIASLVAISIYTTPSKQCLNLIHVFNTVAVFLSMADVVKLIYNYKKETKIN